MKHPQSLEISRPYRSNGEHIERPCRPRYREDEENVERNAAHLQHRDLLPDYRTPSVETRTDHNELRAGIDSVLQTLPSREAKVLRLLYGLGPGRELTLTQIGERLGVSRERVRQISVKALERIRTSFRQKALKPFIEDDPSREE
jgi:RNA polymerase primary sigma factor